MFSCYAVFMTAILLIMTGWSNVSAAIVFENPQRAIVPITALRVQSVDADMTRVFVDSSERFEYTILKPEHRLVAVDLYGVDVSQVQPLASVTGDLIDSVKLKPLQLADNIATRIEVKLVQACEVKSYFEMDSNTLSLDFSRSTEIGRGIEGSVTESVVLDKTDHANSLLTVSEITSDQNNNSFSTLIRLDKQAHFKHFVLHHPERIVVDIPDAQNTISKKVIPVTSKLVQKIRIGNPSLTSTRVVFDLKKEISYNVFEELDGIRVSIGSTNSLEADSVDLKLSESIGNSVHKKKFKNESEKSLKTKKIVPSKEIPAEINQPEDSEFSKSEAKEDHLIAELKPASFTKVSLATEPTREPNNTTVSTAALKHTRSQLGSGQFGDSDFQGEPISLDITGVDLSDILRFVSDNYDINFVLDKSIQKVEVTIKVNNVPWSQVLDSIFRANRLAYKREAKIVRVATVEAFTEEETQRTARRAKEIDNFPLITQYFKLKYEQVTTGTSGGGAGAASGGGSGGGGGMGLRAILSQNLSSRGNISVNPRTNTLIVTDIPERVERAGEIISRLDIAEPQVEIEARIVQANRSFLRDLGIQLFTGVVSPRGGGVALSTAGGQSYGFDFSGQNKTKTGDGLVRGTFTPRNFVADSLFIGPLASGQIGGKGTDTVLSLTTGLIGTGFISAAITAAESKGIVKTISSPRVTVQNNSEGEIRAGQSIPFTSATGVGATAISTTVFIEATLSLRITPQITSEGNVLLRLESTNDSVDTSLRFNGQPPINRQGARTIVLVPDGGTTIIGGVNVDSESSSQTRTPGISSLPLIGNLFKQRFTQRSTQELLFFITPRIFRGETFVTTSESTKP